MRGKLYLGQGILKGRGSIPAHTGGKRRRAWRSKVSQVYPRARGGGTLQYRQEGAQWVYPRARGGDCD